MAISKQQSRNAAFIARYKQIKDAECVAAHSAGWTFNLRTGQCQLGP
jgi:nitrite reductase/ring-hydroxylating ferredoxin subunit